MELSVSWRYFQETTMFSCGIVTYQDVVQVGVWILSGIFALGVFVYVICKKKEAISGVKL